MLSNALRLLINHMTTGTGTKTSTKKVMFVVSVFQTCNIKAEGTKRFLTLKNVQLDQAGEVTYQALNAVTSAMLTVKGTNKPSVA